MKKSVLFTIATCSLLNAGLFDFLGDKEEVKKEIKKEEVIVEKCTVLEKVLNTSESNGIYYGTTVTGTTSCDNAKLEYRFSCNHTLISIESGSSYDGTFSKMFMKVDCSSPSVEVKVK